MITATLLTALLAATIPATPPASTTPPATPPPAVEVPQDDLRQQIFRRQGTGVRALRAGDARAAVADLCWAMERALNSHDAAWYCGQARLLAHDPDGAIRALEIATDLAPEHLPSWVDLAEANAAAGRIDRARAAYYRALELRSDHSPAFDGLARLAAASGDDEAAGTNFQKALDANSADGRALLHRSQWHQARGRDDQALADVREAARLRPDDPEVQAGFSRALLRAGLTDEALAVARRVRTMRPKSPDAAALLAEIYRTLGAPIEAIDAAQEALRLDPDLVSARLTLGRALGASGQIDAALAALVAPNPAILLEPQRVELAQERQRWQNRREELAHLSELVASAAATPSQLLAVASAQLESGAPEQAATTAELALRGGGLERPLLRQAALILARAGRLRVAAPLWEQLTSGAEVEPRDWVNLGIVREGSGDARGARAAYERAAQSSPAPAAAFAGLARLALTEGDMAATISALRSFLAAGPSAEQRPRAEQALSRLTATSAEKKP